MNTRGILFVSLIAALAGLGCAPEPAPDSAPAGEQPTALAAEQPAAPAAEQPAAAQPAAEQPAAAAPAAEQPAADAPAAEQPAADTPGIAGIAGVAPAAREGAPVEAKVPAEDFDLAKVNGALKAREIKDGDALERYINDPDNGISKVDVDGDGKRDVVQIDEVREADEVRFDIRAVPSSTRRVDDAVSIAVVRIRPERDSRRIVVVSEYTDVVIVREHRRYEYVEEVGYDDDGYVVLEPHHHFFTWLFTVERPIYESVVIYEIDHALVHPTRIRIIDHDHCWPPGHCKHHKHKHHKHKRHKYKHRKYDKHHRGKHGKKHKGKKHKKHH